MLSSLHIENIALIARADLCFGQGLNVLTGETGAGKSIILDALGVLMGARVRRDLMREGERTAQVSGIFEALPDLPWFSDMGIFPDENGELSISRRFSAEGKNVCRVAGMPCTVVQLRDLGRQLLQIHGQHDSQQLLDERTHLAYLDGFAQNQALLEDYISAYDALLLLDKQAQELQMNEAEKSRRMDTLQYQIQELERADIQANELETLGETRARLRHSEKIMVALGEASFALSGADDASGALDLLREASRALGQVADVSQDLEALSGQLADLCFGLDDATERVRDLQDSFDASPEALEAVEQRLDVLYRLRKKYGDTTEEMLQYLEDCRRELDAIETAEESLSKLETARKKQAKQVNTKAQRLHEARAEAGKRLQARIEAELRALDMPKVQFFVEILDKETCDRTGGDAVQFLLSANVGEGKKPLHKVASGGELSRIMLALGQVLAEHEPVATLIFDEVDAGISGEAASKVAKKMAQLAQHRQLLCVTHLPQIAARADLHFSVEKAEENGRTLTRVRPLDRKKRIDALAQLTAGKQSTPAIRKAAEELLRQAEQEAKPQMNIGK